MKIANTVAVVVLLCVLGTGCTAVSITEQQRFSDRTMMFDADGVDAELRAHVVSPREASIGGFTAVGAGGCGCN
jgi:hypothetical protein